MLRRRETEKICERRKVERRNSIFVRHISSNGHSWSKSVWIKRDAETWQTEKGDDTLSNTNEPSAAALIRAQGQQIRQETAWEYLQRRCGLRGDAGGDNKGAAPGIPE